MATPDTEYQKLPVPEPEKVKGIYLELLALGFSEMYEELPPAYTLAEFAYHVAQVRLLEEQAAQGRPEITEAVTFNPELVTRADEVFEKFKLRPVAAEDFHRRQAFLSLTKTWQKETMHLSNPNQIAAHPAYRRIVRMGRPVLPLILEDLKLHRGQWFMALREITGANPVPMEHAGEIDRMTQDWFDWAAKEGLMEKVEILEFGNMTKAEWKQ